MKSDLGSAPAVERPTPLGYLVRCSVCEREERTGGNPLKDGWPKCHEYTMTLIETERFVAAIDDAMGEIFSPVERARRAAGL